MLEKSGIFCTSKAEETCFKTDRAFLELLINDEREFRKATIELAIESGCLSYSLAARFA